jgi:hypothetical protein
MNQPNIFDIRTDPLKSIATPEPWQCGNFLVLAGYDELLPIRAAKYGKVHKPSQEPGTGYLLPASVEQRPVETNVRVATDGRRSTVLTDVDIYR